MEASLKTVQTLLGSLRDMIRRIGNKDPTLNARDIGTFFYRSIHDLKRCAPAYLNETEAIDALLQAAPEFESYRGKGTQEISRGYPEILHTILMELEHGFLSSCSGSPAEYREEKTKPTLEKMTAFAIERAAGNGKTIRSKRAAQLRQSYWSLLTDISGHNPSATALALAKKVAPDENRSLPERRGALHYLLTHLGSMGKKTTDPEIKSIISNIRENPPNRDFLFEILDAEVRSGEIDEMTALFDLEDWDEANGN